MKKTNPIIRLAYFIICVIGFSSGAMAQEFSVQSGDWEDPSTWNEGVPETRYYFRRWYAAEDVVIKSGTVVVLTKDIAFGWPRTLTIEEGAILTGDYNVYIGAGGTFANDGTLYATSITVESIATFENNGVTIVDNARFNRGFFGSSVIQNEGEITVSETLINYSTNVSGEGNYLVETTTGNPLPEDSEVDNRWTGGAGTGWENESNWYSGELPLATDEVSIGLNITNFPEINSTQTIADITISGSSKLTVKANGRLRVTNTLENNGELLVESNSSSETGSLYLNNKSGNGTVKVERYIPDELSGDDWHTLSSPISGIDLATFAANSEINYSATYGDYDLAPYNTEDGEWGPYVKAGSGSFVLGRGYSMRRTLNPVNPEITFTSSMSNLNIGNVDLAITYGLNGWNALGNPFVSPINIESFLNTNSGAIYEAPYNVAYLWDPTLSDFTGVATGHIALGQGFLIKSKTGGSTINFTTSMQVQSAPTFKSSQLPCKTIHLFAAAENSMNKTTVKFRTDMTEGLDNMHDIGKYKGNPEIALYTRMPNSSAYDLQDQGLPEIGSNAVIIPIGLDFESGGDITFFAKTESFPEDLEIFLQDVETGIYTPLNLKIASYEARVAAESRGTGRFNLIVRRQLKTGIETDNENQYKVHTRNKIIFINGPVKTDTDFELFNIEGRCYYRGKAQNQNLNQIDGSAFPAGVYLLKINESGSTHSTKFVLNED